MTTLPPRDHTLDIAKGLSIILMVMGHAGAPEALTRVIEVFNMPCFFFISGWLLHDKYISHQLFTGLKKKMTQLYWPFVKWFGLFALLHNLLVGLHISPPPTHSMGELWSKLVKILLLTGSEPLLGGFWFIYTLLFASIIGMLGLHLLQRSHLSPRLYASSIALSIVLILAIVYYFPSLPFTLPSRFGITFWNALAFFLTGYLAHQLRYFRHLMQVRSWWLWCVLLLPVAAHLELGAMTMHNTIGTYTFTYFIVALLGTWSILLLSRLLGTTLLRAPLAYIGRNTLYILALHLMGFKAVTWAYIMVYDLPITRLTDYPMLTDAPAWSWIPYSIIGLGLPLLLWHSKKLLTQYMRRFMTQSA